MTDELKEIPTYQDGRASLHELYRKFMELEQKFGWTREIIYSIKIQSSNGEVDVPVYCFLSPKSGKSLWLLTGIHGEEPSGPNAVFRNIDLLGKLGQTIPMVVMPLLNPAGYYRNWRFHNVERSRERLNVTDCRHLVEDPKNPGKPILEKPVHQIADIFTKYVLELLKSYPPLVYFDLHEDELLPEGYVYSQGSMEARDLVAIKTVELLVSEGMPIKMSGPTRFAGEIITNGVVTDEAGKRVWDGSIDEFIANETYIDEHGKTVSKPFAGSSVVPETSAGGKLTLEDRIRAQGAIVKNLGELWKINEK